jgi:hypothetical protein
MEREELIIWVYLWVCDQVEAWRQEQPAKRARLRRAGFAPALSDEEALCIELCGEMLRLQSDKAIYCHFKTHYQEWFPHLKDRPAFVRQCANLWRLKLVLQERLLRAHHVPLHPLQPVDTLPLPVDTLPLPVCAKARAHRDRCFAGVARKGYCAAKDLFYYGFKLGLRVTQAGFIASYALLEANTHDCRHLPALVEGHQGLVPVDKGFFDPALWRQLFGQGTHIVGRGPKRVDKHRPPELELPAPIEKLCARIRKTVEVVASLLCSRFAVDHIRVHDLWHFEHRLLRKILAFNLLVALNIERARKPLDLDGLVRD